LHFQYYKSCLQPPAIPRLRPQGQLHLASCRGIPADIPCKYACCSHHASLSRAARREPASARTKLSVAADPGLKTGACFTAHVSAANNYSKKTKQHAGLVADNAQTPAPVTLPWPTQPRPGPAPPAGPARAAAAAPGAARCPACPARGTASLTWHAKEPGSAWFQSGPRLAPPLAAGRQR